MKYLLLLICLIWNVSASLSYGQDTTVSLAFKKNAQRFSHPFFYRPDLSYKLQQQFNLIKMANAGDALAQHELGLRYLQGIDIENDTSAAAMWIEKAALQELPSACYNYGILLLNGWGVPWNPFLAYKYFYKAAEEGMPQAQYIIGVLHTDNLIVKKDLAQAWEWLKKAEKGEYEPASDVLKDLNSKVFKNNSDSSVQVPKQNMKQSSGSSLVYIDFDIDDNNDREVTPDDLTAALMLSGNKELISSSVIYNGNDSAVTLESVNRQLLIEAAYAGCPEANNLLGYFYLTGTGIAADTITAAISFYMAAKLESRNGILLLWNLSRSDRFMNNLELQVKRNNPQAMFLLYALSRFNFTDVLSEQQEKNFLFRAAESNNNIALTEAALNIYSGKYKNEKKEAGIELLRQIKNDPVAEQRYISIQIIDSSYADAETISRLTSYADKGSIIAETLLGYCYSTGTGTVQNKSLAVKYLRSSAQRGSKFAFNQLEKLYNEIRPDEQVFQID